MLTDCKGQFVLSKSGNGMCHSSIFHVTLPRGVRMTPPVCASLQPARPALWSSQQHSPAGLNDTASSARRTFQAFPHINFPTWTHKITEVPHLKPFLQKTTAMTEHCSLPQVLGLRGANSWFHLLRCGACCVGSSWTAVPRPCWQHPQPTLGTPWGCDVAPQGDTSSGLGAV